MHSVMKFALPVAWYYITSATTDPENHTKLYRHEHGALALPPCFRPAVRWNWRLFYVKRWSVLVNKLLALSCNINALYFFLQWVTVMSSFEEFIRKLAEVLKMDSLPLELASNLAGSYCMFFIIAICVYNKSGIFIAVVFISIQLQVHAGF